LWFQWVGIKGRGLCGEIQLAFLAELPGADKSRHEAFKLVQRCAVSHKGGIQRASGCAGWPGGGDGFNDRLNNEAEGLDGV